MSRNHEKLRVFQVADSLALHVYLHSASFPATERFGLQSQLRRAAVSVATNIVEGCARRSRADYARFLDIASAQPLKPIISWTSPAGSAC
jgi:four helix bundle protein